MHHPLFIDSAGKIASLSSFSFLLRKVSFTPIGVVPTSPALGQITLSPPPILGDLITHIDNTNYFWDGVQWQQI